MFWTIGYYLLGCNVKAAKPAHSCDEHCCVKLKVIRSVHHRFWRVCTVNNLFNGVIYHSES